MPQLLENYRQGSASGISITFLVIWMIGDVTNLAGAIWADLVPTVIALAVYFSFSDAVLLGQCVYYNAINARLDAAEAAKSDVPSERDPLLSPSGPQRQQQRPSQTPQLRRGSSNASFNINADNIGLPGSRRRSSATSRRRSSTVASSGPVRPVAEESDSNTQTPARVWAKNTLSVLAIIVAGTGGWAVAWRAGAWRPQPINNVPHDRKMPLGAEVLGYISAACYLGARIPQIVKNHHEKSCDGLSMLFFMLSLLGNITYGAGILLHSVEREYIVKNLPWLLGSFGTIAEDVCIFVQFSMYGERDSAIDDED